MKDAIRSRILSRTLTGVVLAGCLMSAFIAPVHADDHHGRGGDDRGRHEDRGHDRGWHGGYQHQAYGGYYRPRQIPYYYRTYAYAPVYAPPPVVYYPQPAPSFFNFVIPLSFD